MSTISYYMSQGAGTKMYTLWQEISSDKFYKTRFVQNLSIDKEQAWKRALEIANENELFDYSMDHLKTIVRTDSGLINFGKYYGKSVNEIPDTYLCWIAEGCPIKHADAEVGEYTTYKDISDLLRNNARQLAIEKGLFVEYNGKYISSKLMEWIQAESLGWGYHYPEKSKVNLDLKILKSTGYNTAYGYISIVTYIDTQNKKYQYKGANPPYIEDKESWFSCTATVKHDSYKDREICQLQRIKIISQPKLV